MSLDDRIVCSDCASFRRDRCNVASEHKLLGVWSFIESLVDQPTRCIFFAPRPGAADPRTGAARYPWLWAEYQAVKEERHRVFRSHAARGLERAKEAIA